MVFIAHMYSSKQENHIESRTYEGYLHKKILGEPPL